MLQTIIFVLVVISWALATLTFDKKEYHEIHVALTFAMIILAILLVLVGI